MAFYLQMWFWVELMTFITCFQVLGFFPKAWGRSGGNTKLFKWSYRLYPIHVYIYVNYLKYAILLPSKEQKVHSSGQLKIRHHHPRHTQFFCLFNEFSYARLLVLSMSAIPEHCYSWSLYFHTAWPLLRNVDREKSCIWRHCNVKQAYYHLQLLPLCDEVRIHFT